MKGENVKEGKKERNKELRNKMKEERHERVGSDCLPWREMG